MSRQLWPLSYGPCVHSRCASVYHVPLALDEALQPLRPRGVPQLPQRLRLDLADALARHLEVLPDLLERVVALLADPEPHPEDLLLAGGEGGEHLPGLLREVHVDDRVGGGDERLVLDEVPEVAVLLLADRGLEADGLLRDLEDLADLVERELHLLGDLLRRRLAPELLHEIAARPDELVDRLDHVDGDADRPRLVGDRARDRLADPPRCIGRELVAALVLELVDRLHEADVPLLDEVEELQAAVRVLLRDRHDEPQIRLDELGLRPLGPVLALADRPVGAAQVLARHLAARRGAVLLVRVRLLLDAADLSRGGPELAVELLELLRGAAELLRDLLPLALVLARVAQHPRELAPGHPGAPLGVEPVPVRLLEPLDEPLQLHDDPVDLLLVELDRLEVLHHVGLDGLDLVPQLAALHLRHLLRREGLAELPDLALALADVVDVLQHVLDLLLLLLRDLGLLRLAALDHLGGLDRALDLGRLLLDLLLLALRLLLVARVLHDLADADLALAEPLAQLEDLADGDRRREDRGEDLLLALLDPLRDLYLALARQEGDRSHLAQVHAHGVVRLAVAGVVLLLLLLLLVRLLLGLGRLVGELHLLLGAVHDLDVVLAEHRHDVVDLVRARVRRQGVVHLVVGEEALLAAALHERLHLGPLGDVAHVVLRELVVVVIVVVRVGLLGRRRRLGLELLLVVRTRWLAELRALLALARLLGLRRLVALRGLLALRRDLGDRDLLTLLPERGERRLLAERLLRLVLARRTGELRGARGLGLHALRGADDALAVLPCPSPRRRLLRLRGGLLGRLLRGVALAGHVALLLVRLGCAVVVCVTAPRRARLRAATCAATASSSATGAPFFATSARSRSCSTRTASMAAFVTALRSSCSAASRAGRAGPAISRTRRTVEGSAPPASRSSASSGVTAPPMRSRARSASGPGGRSLARFSSSATAARSG